jgi:hypothetical protein
MHPPGQLSADHRVRSRLLATAAGQSRISRARHGDDGEAGGHVPAGAQSARHHSGARLVATWLTRTWRLRSPTAAAAGGTSVYGSVPASSLVTRSASSTTPADRRAHSNPSAKPGPEPCWRAVSGVSRSADHRALYRWPSPGVAASSTSTHASDGGPPSGPRPASADTCTPAAIRGAARARLDSRDFAELELTESRLNKEWWCRVARSRSKPQGAV